MSDLETVADVSRPIWPAYPLTVLAAGFGHWYLGQWRRGAVWLGLYLLALGFLSARTLAGAFDLGEPFVVTALQVESVSYTDVAVPLAVIIVCLLDVYLIGLARRTAPEPMEENGSSG